MVADDIDDPEGTRDRITVRIPKHIVSKLEEWVEYEKSKKVPAYKTISEVIRQGLEEYIENHTEKHGKVTMRIELPQMRVDDINILISAGEVTDLRYAIQKAIDEYLDRRRDIINAHKQ